MLNALDHSVCSDFFFMSSECLFQCTLPFTKKLMLSNMNVTQLGVACYLRGKPYFLFEFFHFTLLVFCNLFASFLLPVLSPSLPLSAGCVDTSPGRSPSATQLSGCLPLVDACRLCGPRALINRSLMASLGG